jgi:hypothetical protein
MKQPTAIKGLFRQPKFLQNVCWVIMYGCLVVDYGLYLVFYA